MTTDNNKIENGIKKKKKISLLLTLLKKFKWFFLIHIIIAFFKEYLFNQIVIKIFNILSLPEGKKILKNTILIDLAKENTLIERMLRYFNKNFNSSILEGLILSLFASILLYSLVKAFDNFIEWSISSKSISYLKTLTFMKFSKLEFGKVEKSNFSRIIHNDCDTVGELWEHLPNHIFHNLVSLFFSFSEIISMINNNKSDKYARDVNSLAIICYSSLLIWDIFFKTLTIRLTNLNQKKYINMMTKENRIIEDYVRRSDLIESMGVSPQKRKVYKNIKEKNEIITSYIDRNNSIIRNVSFLISSIIRYPIFVLILNIFDSSGGNNNLIINVSNFGIFELITNTLLYNIFTVINRNIGGIMHCFINDSSDLFYSLHLIENLLNSEERNDNLDRNKIQGEIEYIRLENVSFGYLNDKRIINNLNIKFNSSNDINELEGRNGSGKSTIFRLIIGILTPTEGNIWLKTKERNEEINLRDINLRDWRERVVIYCSHENLVSHGSTGEKQIRNIKELIEIKKGASIILLDEADNALDKLSSEEIFNQISSYRGGKNKIVVRVRHQQQNEGN